MPLAPPPYRDPPPPNAAVDSKYKKNLLQDFNSSSNKNEEPVLYNSQYRELIHLINFQRDKLSALQADLTKVSFIYCLDRINFIFALSFDVPTTWSGIFYHKIYHNPYKLINYCFSLMRK